MLHFIPLLDETSFWRKYTRFGCDKLFAKNLLAVVKVHIRDNFWYYIAALVLLFIGVVVGTTYASKTEMSQCQSYFDDMFKMVSLEDYSPFKIFLYSASKNAALILALLILSISLIGLPVMCGICLYAGFAASYTLTVIGRIYGMKSILFYLGGLLPHNLIMVPVFLFYFTVSLRFYMYILRTLLKKDRNGFDLKAEIPRYLFVSGICMLLMIAGSFFEGYISYFFIKWMSGIFV